MEFIKRLLIVSNTRDDRRHHRLLEYSVALKETFAAICLSTQAPHTGTLTTQTSSEKTPKLYMKHPGEQRSRSSESREGGREGGKSNQTLHLD